MAIAVTDFGSTGETGTAGRSRAVCCDGTTSKAYYYQPVGNKIAIWDVSDPNNIALEVVVSLAGMASPQINVKAAGIGFGSTILAVVNYDGAGNCYLAVYTPTYTGMSITGLTQTAAVLIGTNAPNPDFNQIDLITDQPYQIVGFGDDVLFYTLSGSVLTLRLTHPVATTPGGQVGGFATNDYFGSPGILYATGKDDAFVAACQIDKSDPDNPTATELWNTPIAGATAGYCYRSNSSDTVQVVAVITYDGAQNFVELFDPDDGTALGVYENVMGGTITDVLLSGSCLYVFTDGSADNAQSVDLTDLNAPTFSESSTLPAGTGYAIQATQFLNLGFGEPYCASANNGTTAALLALDLGTCASVTPPGASGKIACYAVGDFLYSVDDTPQLEITDISDPTTPTSSGTLALDEQPTAIWVNEHNAIVAFHGGFWIVNIDDPTAPTLDETKTTTDSFDFVVAPGGILYLSGEAAKLAIYDPGFTPPGSQDSYPIANGGISSIALEGSRVFFADIAPSGNSKLYSFATGGFTCSSVQAGLMSADEVKAEEFHGRHAKFKGAVVAESLLLTDELEATGIVLIDQTNGDRYRVQMIAGVLTETLL